MSVMNRKMFNRGGRNKLNQMGGIKSVQHFQTAGQVKAPSGQVSLNLSGGPFASSSPIFGSGKYNFGQVYTKNNPYPSTLSGKMFGSGKRFFAPAKSSSPGQMALINVAKKAAEGGMGALDWSELAILQQYLTGQGFKNFIESKGKTDRFGSAGKALSGIANVAGQMAGFPVGIARSWFTEEGGPASEEYDKNLGTFTPDENLLKGLGFTFEEDLYGGQTGRLNKGRDPGLASLLAQPAVAPGSKINPGELQKMLQSSGKEIEGILKRQGDKGMTVIAEEDEFNKDAVPAVITSFDKEGNEIEAQPFGQPSVTADNVTAEGPGAQLDKTDPEITEEELNKILGKYSPPDIKSSTYDGAGGEGEGEGTAEEFPDPTGGLAKRGQPRTSDIEVPKLKPPELVTEIFKTGNDEQKSNTIDDIIKQFTDRAPKYKGINKGLALAKIGFAMAAGDSPDALTNIAKALSDGADMLIKDQSEKDEFERQIQLAALQMGMTDALQEKQLKRGLKFQTADYVLMPGETYTYPDGRTVTGGKEGLTISLNKSDILENGLPDGVQGTAMASALLSKKIATVAALEKIKSDAIKAKTLKTPKAITDHVDDYAESVDAVIQSNNMMHLTQQVMIRNAKGEITGFRPGMNSLIANAMAAAGIEATGYTDRDVAIADLRKVLQKLVPLTLGKDQAANSISNKDVDRLADAFMSKGILDGGILSLMTTPANVLNTKLAGILVEFDNAQNAALARLNSLEATGNEFLTPSGALLGTRVSAQRQRLQPFLPGGGAFAQATFTSGEDGIYRLN